MSAVSSSCQQPVSKTYEPQAKKQRPTSSVTTQRNKIPYAPQKGNKIKAIKVSDPGILHAISTMYFNDDRNVKLGFKILKMAAERGFSEAQLDLSHCYCKGSGTEVNTEKYLIWLNKAVQAYNPKAENELGALHYNGDHVFKCFRLAHNYYRQSAYRGCAEGMHSLGLFYSEGPEDWRDMRRAAEWMRKAADSGIMKAKLWMINYNLRDGGPCESELEYSKRINHAKEDIKSAAKEGNPKARALHRLFNPLARGFIPLPVTASSKRTREENLATFARKYLCKVCITVKSEGKKMIKYKTIKDADVINIIALKYLEGKHIDGNKTIAFRLWKEAAHMQNSDAQFNLAICYEEGDGTEINLEKRMKWLTYAAGNGDMDAQYLRAIETKDEASAFHWMKYAADNGQREAQFKLGVMYAEGSNSIAGKDIIMAKYYFDLASNQDHLEAKVRLIELFLNGELRYKIDIQRVKKLIVEAADLGNVNARQMRSLLEGITS